MHDAFPILRGETNIPSTKMRRFKNLAPLTDSSLVDARPDWSYGTRFEQLNPHVQKQLSRYIVPCPNPRAPILHNNATELKDPSGDWAVVERQALHAGALGARAMQHLQSYGQPELVYDNNAYTITTAFDGRLLQMYTTHPTRPANSEDQPEYRMKQFASYAMTHNSESFRQGATAYRNSRDWTREKRDEFIRAANGRVTSQPQNMPVESSGYSEPSTSSISATALESATSVDEPALESATSVDEPALDSDTSEDALAMDNEGRGHRSRKRVRR